MTESTEPTPQPAGASAIGFRATAWTLPRAYAALLRHGIFAGLLSHVPLVATILLVGAVLFGGLGAGLGLPALFWHETWWKQAMAGAACTLLLAHVTFIAFLLNDLDRPRRSLWIKRLPPLWRSWERRLVVFLVGGLLPVVVIGVLLRFVLPAALAELTLLREGGISQAALRNADVLMSQQTPVSRAADAQVPWWPMIVGAAGGAIAAALLIWVSTWPRVQHNLALPLRRAGGKRVRRMQTTQATDAVLASRAIAGAIAVILLFIAVANMWSAVRAYITPPVALCVLLGLTCAIYGVLRARGVKIVPIVLVLLLLMWVGGIPPYKMRFDGFDLPDDRSYYDRDLLVSAYPAMRPAPGVATQPVPPLISDMDVATGQRRPLVVICASGGGIRAAVWAAEVEAQLEELLPDFAYDTRLITGASGGMLGSAYYVATLKPPTSASAATTSAPSPGDSTASTPANSAGRWHHSVTREQMRDQLATDSLSPAVRAMIFRDVPFLFLPFVNRAHRGRVLEWAWQANTNGILRQTLASLRGGEREGWRPSLLFSPMLVEDGRRLLISNLDLDFLTVAQTPRIITGADDTNTVVATGRASFASRSAYEFGRMFPAAMPNFKLVTAARMSASFPFVSPAGILPTAPRRRVVDAGYYDNYGVSLAADWLRHYLDDENARGWLNRRASGVLLIQIRDSENGFARNATALPATPDSVRSRAMEEISSPPDALLAARDSVSMFRNDAKLQWLHEEFVRRVDDPDYFVVASFEFRGIASLSWYMTSHEKQQIAEHAKKEVDPERLARLRQWWDQRTHSARLMPTAK